MSYFHAKIDETTGIIVGLYSGGELADQQIADGQRWVGIDEKPGFVFVDGHPHYLRKIDIATDQIIDNEIPSPAAPTLDELKATKSELIMTKRDAVINGGITFNTVRFQTRPDDRENVAGAAQLAFMAIVAGALPGDLRWHGGATDFGWIAEDNSVVTMDAPTVIAFAKATAEFKSACIFYARTIKDSTDAAADQAALDAIDITTGWPE